MCYVVCAVLIRIRDGLFSAVREVITRQVIINTQEGQVWETRITVPPFRFKAVDIKWI